jgi:hypothetical protein
LGSRWAVLLALVVTSLLPSSVAATTIHNPPFADIFGSTWSDLNTQPATRDFLNNFDTGYHRFLDIGDTAIQSMSVGFAQDDAVWIDFGHGGPGFITFCAPPGGATCTSALSSTSAVGSCIKPPTNTCLNQYSTTIKRLKFMGFVGCETANSAGAGIPTLLATATGTDQVDSAIGFTDLIYFGFPSDGGEFWAAEFAKSLTAGHTLSSSMAAAVAAVEAANFGFAFGYNGYTVINASTVLHPAAYGS